MAFLRARGRSAAPAMAPSTAQAPAARRLHRARIGDVRLWLGLLLVVGSVVLGARIVGAEEDTVFVLRATRDLAVGSPVDGLVAVRVNRVAVGDQYLSEQPTSGGVLRWPVSAGELVPRSAIGFGAAEPSRQVAVPVDPLRAPPGLQSGDLVDVWSSPRESEPGSPVLVLAGVTVASVSADDRGIQGEVGVLLDVPADDVAGVVQASRSGLIDLVAVPVASQSVDAGRVE